MNRENQHRATRISHTLDTYCQLTGCEKDTAVVDALADLMHFCEASNQHFDDALAQAAMHYEAERRGEP